jgi:hypothetical protein
MCVPIHQRDPKTGFMMALGNVSLFAAIVIWRFAHPAGVVSQPWIDGLSGLLFGLSITVNLGAAIRARRCSPAEGEKP